MTGRGKDDKLVSPGSSGLHVLLSGAECQVEISETRAVMQRRGWLESHSFDYVDFRELWAGLMPEDSSMQNEDTAENATAKADNQLAVAPEHNDKMISWQCQTTRRKRWVCWRKPLTKGEKRPCSRFRHLRKVLHHLMLKLKPKIYALSSGR